MIYISKLLKSVHFFTDERKNYTIKTKEKNFKATYFSKVLQSSSETEETEV